MLKKIWKAIKDFAASSMKIANSEQTAQSNKVGEVKPLSYWSEYAEQLQTLERAKEYHTQQETQEVGVQEERRLTNEEIDSWRENNRRVNEYFSRKARKSERRLYVVA